MLRIEKESDGQTTTLQLSGRVQSANIGDIQAQMDDGHVRLFMALGEVTLVDVEVVRFLSECEDRGIVLVHCHPMFASGFFASEPKGHSRKFRMVSDSRRRYLFRSRRAVLAIEFSLRLPGPTTSKTESISCR
jgi:hypothetical protein